MKYTMTFALTPDFRSVLLLRKPDNHHNPLFRGKWSAPGGKIEDGETEIESAVREFKEETSLEVTPSELRFVARILCNCDPGEVEHEVVAYAVVLLYGYLIEAHGEPDEPVQLFAELPPNRVWHINALFELAVGRMRQPA